MYTNVHKKMYTPIKQMEIFVQMLDYTVVYKNENMSNDQWQRKRVNLESIITYSTTEELAKVQHETEQHWQSWMR